jgi:hypothetical protein
MNQLHLAITFNHTPDCIQVELNNNTIFKGAAFNGTIDLTPKQGTNRLQVHVVKKSAGNFVYSSAKNSVIYDSTVTVNEIIIERRYFRSLLHKCGKVIVDLDLNPGFDRPEIPGSNIITMEGAYYEIEFEYPVKFWMQKMLHGRDLTLPNTYFNFIKTLL